jgi:hypothetical protein
VEPPQEPVTALAAHQVLDDGRLAVRERPVEQQLGDSQPASGRRPAQPAVPQRHDLGGTAVPQQDPPIRAMPSGSEHLPGTHLGQLSRRVDLDGVVAPRRAERT